MTARSEKRQRQAERRKLGKGTAAPARHALTFHHTYGADILSAFGPLVIAYWHVPTAVEHALRASGRPVPPPAGGALILDTGAARTCISLHVAESLLVLQATRLV